MLSKYSVKTYLNYLIKTIQYLVDKINILFSKEFSKIYLITDGASWAVDESTNDILNYFIKNKLRANKALLTPQKQFVYFIDQYSILKNDFYTKKNIVALDYQHGVKKYLKQHVKLLNYVKLHQKNIRLIRVTNSFFKYYLIKSGIKKEKIFQIPIAVDTKKFKYRKNKSFYRKKFNLPTNKILIGSFHKDGVGWGYGEKPKMIKGPDVFVKTLISLSNKIGKEKFHVVLTSPARGYIKRKLKEQNINYTHFYPVNKNNIPLLFSCLDFYLITSRDEGGPRGIFEAMASGIPVISTLVGHAHDHIKNNYNGYKSQIDDYNSMSKNIIKLIKNPKLKKKIIKNSLITARKNNYSNHKKYWKTFIKKFIENKYN